MKKPVHYSIIVNNRQYRYSMRKIDDEMIYFYCKAAHISQEFYHEDISELLYLLPDHIRDAKQYEKRQEVIRFRISMKDKRKIHRKAVNHGYASISQYLRDLALKD